MAEISPLTHLADLPLDVVAELDRKIMTVRELMELDIGTVVKMNRSAGENIDLLIGGTLLGFGEIVIIEDLMGVRITDFHGEE